MSDPVPTEKKAGSDLDGRSMFFNGNLPRAPTRLYQRKNHDRDRLWVVAAYFSMAPRPPEGTTPVTQTSLANQNSQMGFPIKGVAERPEAGSLPRHCGFLFKAGCSAAWAAL